MTANDTNDPNAVGGFLPPTLLRVFANFNTTDLVVRPYDCHLSTKALKDIGIPVHTVSFKDWWYVAHASFHQGMFRRF